MKQFYAIHCGILPLEHRFIVIDYKDSRWAIPAHVAVDLATAYYEKNGWYEECDLREDGLTQLTGEELRDCVEVNADLEHAVKSSEWESLRQQAQLIQGNEDGPDDQAWWFEEHGGSITEMTDLALEKQEPIHLLWFSKKCKALYGLVVS